MQVSRSKKWASKPLLDESGKPVLQKSGKPVLKKSYSVLQDDFFHYMRNAGYTDVERGERGSTEEHLTVSWSNKYHDLWYDVKPYLDALHRAPELVRGFLEKILAPKQERTMNVPQQNRKRGQDVEL